MSAKIEDVRDGLVTVKIAGKLEYADLRALQKAAGDLIDATGTIRVLVLTENFEGWGKEGDWSDTSFHLEFDANIEKMALVGEERWRDLALLFTAKGLRQFPIKYYLPEDIRKAREWLAEGR